MKNLPSQGPKKIGKGSISSFISHTPNPNRAINEEEQNKHSGGFLHTSSSLISKRSIKTTKQKQIKTPPPKFLFQIQNIAKNCEIFGKSKKKPNLFFVCHPANPWTHKCSFLPFLFRKQNSFLLERNESKKSTL